MRLASSGTPFKRVRDSLEIEYTFGGHLVRLSLSRRSRLDGTETAMPSPYQAMGMVLDHFPEAELVEHLPILQGFVNALLNAQCPSEVSGEVREFRFPLHCEGEMKVIAKHHNGAWVVYEYEIGGE